MYIGFLTAGLFLSSETTGVYESCLVSRDALGINPSYPVFVGNNTRLHGVTLPAKLYTHTMFQVGFVYQLERDYTTLIAFNFTHAPNQPCSTFRQRIFPEGDRAIRCDQVDDVTLLYPTTAERVLCLAQMAETIVPNAPSVIVYPAEFALRPTEIYETDACQVTANMRGYNGTTYAYKPNTPEMFYNWDAIPISPNGSVIAPGPFPSGAPAVSPRLLHLISRTSPTTYIHDTFQTTGFLTINGSCVEVWSQSLIHNVVDGVTGLRNALAGDPQYTCNFYRSNVFDENVVARTSTMCSGNRGSLAGVELNCDVLRSLMCVTTLATTSAPTTLQPTSQPTTGRPSQAPSRTPSSSPTRRPTTRSPTPPTTPGPTQFPTQPTSMPTSIPVTPTSAPEPTRTPIIQTLGAVAGVLALLVLAVVVV